MRFFSTRKAGAGFLAALFLLSVLSITPAQANPLVPSCGPASVAGGTEATAGAAYDPSICETLTGRVFPEAFAQPEYFQADASGHANTGVATDYISYFEFQQGLAYLEESYPDYIEVHEVADSYGLCPVPGHTPLTPCPVALERHPVYMVEVTNELSPVPLEERQAMLFMLSIHGVEKGGREGGMRVLEDLLKGIGFASETVQNGAGLPSPIPRPGGDGNVETYHDYLDFQRMFLLFPNTDGWKHDEIPYVTSNPSCGAPPNGVLFCRTNGNGVDLNRQAPTLGWHNSGRNPVGEPESIGYYNWMLEQNIDWSFAIDIHGMLNHQNFGAIMMPAGSMTPLEMEKSLGLAETLKQRLNDDPHFDEWLTLMAAAETVDQAIICQLADCPAGSGSGLTSTVGSTQFAEYYTVIDAIGYTDSGFNGDFFAQDTGLNAPGYDIELAYNHLTLDSQYEGPGALWNDYHVKMVREIAKSFMDAGALDIQISFDTGGQRTLYLEPSFVATNLDDEDPNLPGSTWAAQNDGDDLWDYSEETPFISRPAKYWEDLKPYVVNGDEPGVLARTTASGLTAAKLEGFDTLVIPGTAINGLMLTGVAGENDFKRDDDGAIGMPDQNRIDAIAEWVDAGGKLILTDASLKFLDFAGITTDAVDVRPQYMGGIKVDLNNDGSADDHPLLKDLNDGVMQMYEPTPIGFGTTGSAPNWFVDEAAFNGVGGSIAGRMCGSQQLNNPACDANGIGLGTIPYGSGEIHVMGSVLPDPTEEFYHPYGLDHYATTYSANVVMLNMLGWDKIYAAPPVVITEDGQIIQTENEQAPVNDDTTVGGDEGGKKKTPGVGVFAVFGLLGALVAARRK